MESVQALRDHIKRLDAEALAYQRDLSNLALTYQSEATDWNERLSVLSESRDKEASAHSVARKEKDDVLIRLSELEMKHANLANTNKTIRLKLEQYEDQCAKEDNWHSSIVKEHSATTRNLEQDLAKE